VNYTSIIILSQGKVNTIAHFYKKTGNMQKNDDEISMKAEFSFGRKIKMNRCRY
jgi:hypothetical protein